MSDKPLSEYEMDLQEFFISGFNRTNIVSMIYSISRSKGECLGYFEQSVDPKSETWIKPTKPFSPSSA